MEEKLKEDLKNLNIPESKIEEISKKKKFVERLRFVLEQAKIKKGDKELGLLLIQLAEKLNPAYNHRLPLLLKYVIPKDISSSQQLDAAIAYLRKKGEEEINKEEFEKQCGIGVKVTEDDIRKEVNELMKSKLDVIKKQRYNFPSLNILYDLKKKFVLGFGFEHLEVAHGQGQREDAVATVDRLQCQLAFVNVRMVVDETEAMIVIHARLPRPAAAVADGDVVVGVGGDVNQHRVLTFAVYRVVLQAGQNGVVEDVHVVESETRIKLTLAHFIVVDMVILRSIDVEIGDVAS